MRLRKEDGKFIADVDDYIELNENPDALTDIDLILSRLWAEKNISLYAFV